MFKVSIKAARVNAGLNIVEAAEKLGVTKDTLSKYERGATNYSHEILNKMLEVYNVPFENIRF